METMRSQAEPNESQAQNLELETSPVSAEKKQEFDEFLQQYDKYDDFQSWPTDANMNQLDDATWTEARCWLRDQDGQFAQYLIANVCHGDASQLGLREVNYLFFCANADQAPFLTEALLLQKNVLTFDNERDHLILDVLKRVGTIDQVTQLAEYARARATLDDPDELTMKVFDVETTIISLYGIQNRASQTGDRDRISETITNVAGLPNIEISEDRLYELESIAKQSVARYGENFIPRSELYPDDEDDFDETYNQASEWEEQHNNTPIDWYAEKKEADSRARVDVVRKLDEATKADRPRSYLPRLELHEVNPSPYAVTLGIEIEVYAPTVIKGYSEMNEDEQYYERNEVRPRFALTEELGVPKGNDGLWEFANAPVQYYETLGREVHALMDMGLINREHKRHPLHITIGGVDMDGPGGEGVFTIARALEATGWSTTYHRMLKPALTGADSWNFKGIAGVKPRAPSELAQNQSSGKEIRTMQVQSMDGLHRTLAGAYYLGAALRAYQTREADVSSHNDPDLMRLAEVWTRFDAEVKALFVRYGLHEPGKDWISPARDENKEYFWPLANHLRDAREYSTSAGAQFAQAIQLLIIRARRDAKRVMYPATDSEAELSTT